MAVRQLQASAANQRPHDRLDSPRYSADSGPTSRSQNAGDAPVHRIDNNAQLRTNRHLLVSHRSSSKHRRCHSKRLGRTVGRIGNLVLQLVLPTPNEFYSEGCTTRNLLAKRIAMQAWPSLPRVSEHSVTRGDQSRPQRRAAAGLGAKHL